MAVPGLIAQAAKSHLPVTWTALANDERYGEAELARKVDYVKFNLFGEVVLPEEEALLYDPNVIEYAGKLVAIQIIPAGADYWATQKIVDSSGGHHNASFIDRSTALWRLHEKLVAEAAASRPDIDGSVTVRPKRRRIPVGVRDTTSTKLTTLDPHAFPREAVPVTEADTIGGVDVA